ncbi:putative mitochondrial protein, partial [Mucuna pruriens]
MDPSKVKSVLQWPMPKNAKGVRGFLVLTGYYRKFKDYGKVAKPFIEITKKEGFKWSSKHKMLLECLKRRSHLHQYWLCPISTRKLRKICLCKGANGSSFGYSTLEALLGCKFTVCIDQKILVAATVTTSDHYGSTKYCYNE